jgi:flagellar hook protein FlgE
MGLASALNTALTGMSASETTIGVIGNNLANADTAGFKASDADFATQFLQTQTIGSAPSTDSSGTNPIQTGLGALVASITPNFTQGTIQTANSPTDMAIQGDGFFMVQGDAGQNLYTRDGVFQLNSSNTLTTSTGNAVMGWGAVNYVVQQQSTPVPITIPLGSDTVAEQTSKVSLSGSLSPTGTAASLSQVLQSGFIGDSSYLAPSSTTPKAQTVTNPTAQDSSGTATNTTTGSSAGGGLTADDTYSYELVALDSTTGTQETVYSSLSATLGATDNQVTLANLPTPATGTTLALYRANLTTGGTTPTYSLVASSDSTQTPGAVLSGASYTDTTADASLPAAVATGAVVPTTLNANSLTGNYSYYVTYYNSNSGKESCPGPVSNTYTANDGAIELTNLPTIPNPNPNGYNAIRIYRNEAGGTTYYQVGQIDNNSSSTFTDNVSDATIAKKTQLNTEGPAITGNSLAVDMTQDGSNIFTVGDKLQFTADVGGATVATAGPFTVTSSTKVNDVLQFLQNALGIQTAPGNDPNNPITADSNSYTPGITINNGEIQVVSNTGTANAVSIGATDLQVTNGVGTSSNLNLNFNTEQTGNGASASTDFVAYDTIGTPLNVHLTTVLQGVSANGTTTYRWYADCPTNVATATDGDSQVTETSSAVGTGVITFNSNGQYTGVSNSQVTVQGTGVSGGAVNFNLDFSQISGLASSTNSLAVSSQDGSAPGTLSSFTISQDGTINGVFSNGITRTLGQIVVTRFDNPAGLEQQGQNLYAAGVNSGVAQTNAPGSNGSGTIVGGATELSNTDIGANLVDLILASTMYQSNSQVITTANTLFNDLLTLVRNG